MAAIHIPERLRKECQFTPERKRWLDQLPTYIAELQERWDLQIHAPFDHAEGSCAWVAPATRADGSQAVLKLGMPHMEGEHEIQALALLEGDPSVLLYNCDPVPNALLIEACVPGTPLRALPEPEQDVVIAQLIRRFWRVPVAPHPFRPLAEMITMWGDETRAFRDRWTDVGLVEAGLQLFAELPATADRHVLLATDLHAGNVLAAARTPWLVIDPKPFVGDPAYDATQHLLDCAERLTADPIGLCTRFADLLEVDAERVRLWTFARIAAEWNLAWGDSAPAVARVLA